MLEILHFIFRDFWTFCGVAILACIFGEYCIVAPLNAITRIITRKENTKVKEPLIKSGDEDA